MAIGLITKDFPVELELKDNGQGTGVFAGYCATWDGPDKSNEIIKKGAFIDLPTFVKEGWVGVSHATKDLAIGMIDFAKQDDRGLYVRGIFHSHAQAQAARTTIRERLAHGKICPMSIGYKVLDSEPIRMNGKMVTQLNKLDLRECSFCNMAANPMAGAFEAKRARPELLSIKDLGDWLQSKEGRTVSGDNLRILVTHRNELQDAVDMLSSFIDVHDQNSGQSNPFQAIDDSVAASGGRTGGGAAVARAAKTLQTWLEIQKKYGRQLSAEHHRELSDLHARLHFAVEDLGGFLAMHRPGAVDDVGASLDKSSNPFLEGFQRIDGKRAKLLELRAKMEDLSNRVLIAVYAEEERTEALARKSKR